MKSMLFNEKALEALRAIAAWDTAILAIIICVSLQSLPINRQEISLFMNMFQFFMIKYVVVLLLIYGLIRLLGSKTKFKQFAMVTSTVYSFGLILTTILAYISILIFELLLKIGVVSGFIQSLVPFYQSVLFGWSCESESQLKNWRGIVVGVVAIALLFLSIMYLDTLLCPLGYVQMFGIGGILC